MADKERNFYAVSPSNGIFQIAANSSTPRRNKYNNNNNMSSKSINPHLKRPYLGPVLTIILINIEGVTRVKEELLSAICKSTSYDIMCIQETHRNQPLNSPSISGMKLVAIRHHKKYSSAIFVKHHIVIQSVKIHKQNNIELITVHLPNISFSSIYIPPNSPFITSNLKSECSL